MPQDLGKQANSEAYVFLLFVNMPDLKPDILFGQGSWWVGNDIFKALHQVSG